MMTARISVLQPARGRVGWPYDGLGTKKMSFNSLQATTAPKRVILPQSGVHSKALNKRIQSKFGLAAETVNVRALFMSFESGFRRGRLLGSVRFRPLLSARAFSCFCACCTRDNQLETRKITFLSERPYLAALEVNNNHASHPPWDRCG
jgi:hypothetical protein